MNQPTARIIPQAQSSAPNADAPLRLLQIEAEARRRESAGELRHHLANETRAVLDFRQAFVFRAKGGALRLQVVSSLSAFDRQSPLVRSVEAIVARLRKAEGGKEVQILPPATGPDAESLAFPHMLWAPLLTRKGKLAGGVLFVRERPWVDRHKALALRISETYSHALSGLTRDRIGVVSRPMRRGLLALSLVAIAAGLAVPVPVTAISPVEIVGRDPVVVASALDGALSQMVVTANQRVDKGDVLFRLDDTELRNAAEIAAQQVMVAAARLSATSSTAFGSAEARRDLAIAEAELELAEAEQALADERLALTEIRAPAAGLAIFDQTEEWTGRPVSVGERIIRIIDPAQVEYRLALAVGDLIALDGDEDVRVFLDSDPLRMREARITRSSYHATAQPDGSLAYTVFAEDMADPAQFATPRIGARGSAQIVGAPAPLAFVLLRRPLSWLRQNFGV